MYKLGESSGPWRYAGRHGWVTEEEFHELGQSNQLKLGSGAWNTAIQGLQRDALALYKQLPDEWEENIERTASQVAENVGNAYNSLPEVVKEQVQKVKTGFIDIPAQAIQNLSDLDGHIAAGHKYGGLHPGPLEFGLEAAHTALTSGGSQVRRLKHLDDLAKVTQELTINRNYFANPLPDNRQIKKVVEIGKDVATKPVAKAASRTNGNGKLKNGPINGDTNGESNGIIKGNSSTTATNSDNELVEYAAHILSKEQDKLRAMAENLPKGPEKSGLIELAGENKRGQSLLLTTYPDAQLIKDQGKFFDALSNAGDDPKLILKALKRNFDRIKTQHNLSGSSNMGVEFTLEAHHELYAIESALGVLNVSPQVRREVLQIQLDRGVRYGDHNDNVRGLFKGAHREAHPQGFQAPSSEALVERVKLLKNPSAREIADAMNDVAIHSRKLSLQAAQGKSQIQTAWDLINGILSPQEIKIFTDLGINFADTKDPLWQQIRRYIEGSGRLQHLGKQASAIFESMTLESMNIA